jgi:hypothetical protein
MEVPLVAITRDIERIEQTTGRIVEGNRNSFEALADNAVALQEQNLRFAQNWFTGGIALLRNQAETNRRTAGVVEENLRKQREGLQELARETTDAYVDLFRTSFSYAEFGARNARQLAEQNAEQGLRAVGQTARIGTGAAQQSTQFGARSAEELTRDAESGARGAQEEKSNGQLPIKNYDELTVGEISKRLNNLSEQEIKKVRDYEKRNKSRDTLLEQLDRKINASS